MPEPAFFAIGLASALACASLGGGLYEASVVDLVTCGATLAAFVQAAHIG